MDRALQPGRLYSLNRDQKGVPTPILRRSEYSTPLDSIPHISHFDTYYRTEQSQFHYFAIRAAPREVVLPAVGSEGISAAILLVPSCFTAVSLDPLPPL